MPNHPDREYLQQLLREDLLSFIIRCFQIIAPRGRYLHNWHVEVMADQLQRCYHGETNRLIITLPPRYLKSICASVAFSAWLLGRQPNSRIITACYSNELAGKHARDTKEIMTSDWFIEIFPNCRLDRRKITETELTTTAGGFRLSTSVGGTLTGRGGDFIIVDDPLKADEAMSETKRNSVNQWLSNTVFSRLDDKKNGCIIVVTQRLHDDDLVGNLLNSGGDWIHLNLPAIAENDERFTLAMGQVVGRRRGEALHPDRESLETLEKIKRELGSHAFSAQYQQNPIPVDGELIKWEWFRFYDRPLERQAGDLIVLSFDTASKAEQINDYSVCTVWLRRGNEHYLLDVQRRRLEFPALKRFVAQMTERYQPDAVLVEDAGSGTQLIQDLKERGQIRPIAITPEGDKLTRMYVQTPKIEAGYVLLPLSASWLEDFRTEVLQFPKGKHDDQVDSMSQYLAWRGTGQITSDMFIQAPNPFAEECDRELGLFDTSYSDW